MFGKCFKNVWKMSETVSKHIPKIPAHIDPCLGGLVHDVIQVNVKIHVVQFRYLHKVVQVIISALHRPFRAVSNTHHDRQHQYNFQPGFPLRENRYKFRIPIGAALF